MEFEVYLAHGIDHRVALLFGSRMRFSVHLYCRVFGTTLIVHYCDTVALNIP